MAFEELPEELMSLILVKLPVKTLLRCKCVRKSWYSLIKSPQFIHLHLITKRSSSSSSSSASSKTNYDCFIIRRCVQQPRHVLSFHSCETLADSGNEINVPFPIWYGNDKDVSSFGHCNGLICITNHYDQILICNPALREFRSLFIPPSFGDRSGYHVDSVAYGADPKTGEHKVVMIGVPYDFSHLYDSDLSDEECVDYSGEDNFGDREAKVYDFSTDSWRETAGAVVIPGPFRYLSHPVWLNGSFHWCPLRCPFPLDATILTFHISNEVTESIPLPDFVNVSCHRILFVTSKLQLALIFRDDGVGDWKEICVMTEYGVKESWTRLFKIGSNLDCYWPLAFWDEQQLLVLTATSMNNQQLFSCDLQHQSLRQFPIYGDLSVNPYSESLVSVNGI